MYKYLWHLYITYGSLVSGLALHRFASLSPYLNEIRTNKDLEAVLKCNTATSPM